MLIGRAERAHLVDLSARFFGIYKYIVRTSSSQCACVTCARFYLGDSQSLYIRSLLYALLYVYRRRLRRRRERESVVPANLCIVIGCATKRARGYRDRRGKGGQLDVVCGTGLYRLGGKFLGLNQVRRVAGESDQDREVRLQALRTKDPGSVPLELVVSVLVTVVSFTLTCFSSHLIVTGTDPDAHHVSLQTAPGTVWLQWACCQPPPGCGLLCSESAPPSL